MAQDNSRLIALKPNASIARRDGVALTGPVLSEADLEDPDRGVDAANGPSHTDRREPGDAASGARASVQISCLALRGSFGAASFLGRGRGQSRRAALGRVGGGGENRPGADTLRTIVADAPVPDAHGHDGQSGVIRWRLRAALPDFVPVSFNFYQAICAEWNATARRFSELGFAPRTKLTDQTLVEGPFRDVRHASPEPCPDCRRRNSGRQRHDAPGWAEAVFHQSGQCHPGGAAGHQKPAAEPAVPHILLRRR